MTTSATLSPTPPETPARLKPKPTSLRQAWPAIFGLCLTMMVEMLDNSILNVALPTIGRDLHATATDLQRFVGAYSLTFGGLLMVGGTLGDKFGRRRTLLFGLALFGLAGLSVIFVTTPEGLIAVRAISGIFAAAIAPLTMSLVFRLFDDAALRTRAIGLIVTISMIGFAVGPTLSGIAIEHFDWKFLLILNGPMAFIAWIGVRWGVEKDDSADLRAGGSDISGAILSVAALGLILYSFTMGAEEGWLSLNTISIAGAGICSLIAFIIRERLAADPMLDMKLFSKPEVRGSAILQMSAMLSMVGVMFASSQLFQYAWGWQPWKAGLANLPFVIGMLLARPLVESLVKKLGHAKASAVAILAILLSLGLWVIALHTGYLAAALGMLLMTMGNRLIMTTGAVALISALPEDQTSIGSALNDTVQELGNAVGVAIVGTIIAVVVGSQLPQGAWDAHTISQFVDSQTIAFTILTAALVILGIMGVRTLSNSTEVDDH